MPQSLIKTSSVAPASTSTSRSSAALTASLVKWAATLGDGGSLYHSCVGLSATDQAKRSPVAEQISAVCLARTYVIPTARMVSTTVAGADPSGRQTWSVASSDADRI